LPPADVPDPTVRDRASADTIEIEQPFGNVVMLYRKGLKGQY
jgi:hypothetical protein